MAGSGIDYVTARSLGSKGVIEMPEKKTEVVGDRFVALQLDKDVGVGDSVVVVASAESQIDLLTSVERLTGATPEWVCIVEIKRMLSRRMLYEVSDAERTFINR